MAFSPDGAYALTGCWDTTLMLWDVASGKRLKTFEGHLGPVNAVAFSPGGRRIVSVSEDTMGIVWQPGLEYAKAAPEWAKAWRAASDADRKRKLEEVWAGFETADLELWLEARERWMALGADGVPALLERFKPEEASKADEEQLAEAFKCLDSDDESVRKQGRAKLSAVGRAALEWLERRREAGGISDRVRSTLDEILVSIHRKPIEMGDLGRVRAVLTLMEMMPLGAARAALEQYARGPLQSYAADLARRALR